MKEEFLQIDNETEQDDDDINLNSFSLVTTPNDFNITTIINFMDRGVFIIPSFQRNFVWDIKKSSKLIESLIMGLPIPQIFLYEKERNKFYVIDGQQRLLTLYFFYKGRFPKTDKARNKIKENTKDKDSDGQFISTKLLNDDEYFKNFPLKLESKLEPSENKLHNKKFDNLDDSVRADLELATVRNMVIRQKYPEDDTEHLAMFEIFNRLNSGGMNLSNQEIRMSLYSSDFMSAIIEMNKNPIWRKLIGKSEPDLRLKDSELVLRLFAILMCDPELNIDGNISYSNSLIGFLNSFANYSKKFTSSKLELLRNIWIDTMESFSDIKPYELSNNNSENSKLSTPVIESLFAVIGRKILNTGLNPPKITSSFISELKSKTDFLSFCVDKTTYKLNIQGRLRIASEFYEEFYKIKS